MKNTTTVARQYLQLKDKLDELQAVFSEVEEALKEALADSKTIMVDGRTISLVESKRRSFDADLLKELVSASIFRKVTVPAVKTSLFDAAVSMGNIDHDIIEQIVTVTPYQQLRVK